MKSKASIKSHPIHPILICFPIAFFMGTLVFDILGLLLNNYSLTTTAMYLEVAGIIGAVLAAIPGIIDYKYTVPPHSSAKKRATQHGLLNSAMLLIFICAWFYRRINEPLVEVVIGLEVAGVLILSVAGWLGGTLVYRNQIGVDPRYANAGKWKEEYINDTGDLIVADVEELQVNQMKLVHIKDKRIVIARTEEKYVAFDDRCPHRGGSLAGGSMMCGTVQCPWHGSQFDVKTGMVKAGPGNEKITTYELIETNGRISIRFE